MARNRKEILLDNAIAYLYEISVDIDDYVKSLRYIGMNKGEIYLDLVNDCGINPTNAEEIIDRVYKGAK